VPIITDGCYVPQGKTIIRIPKRIYKQNGIKELRQVLSPYLSFALPATSWGQL